MTGVQSKRPRPTSVPARAAFTESVGYSCGVIPAMVVLRSVNETSASAVVCTASTDWTARYPTHVLRYPGTVTLVRLGRAVVVDPPFEESAPAMGAYPPEPAKFHRHAGGRAFACSVATWIAQLSARSEERR